MPVIGSRIPKARMQDALTGTENVKAMSESQNATVLIASKSGRLGNRLFQSAHFMGNSLAHGYRLLNPSLDEYAPLLQGSRQDPLCGTPVCFPSGDPEFAAQLRTIALRLSEILVPAAAMIRPQAVRILDIRESHDAVGASYDMSNPDFLGLLQPGGLVAMRGWSFSDHPNLARFRPQILRYHAPVDPIAAAARLAVNRAKEASGMVIGVHIRQEDYRFWKGGIHYYEVEDYARWMRSCAEVWSDADPAFLICSSNEIDPAPFRGIRTVRGPGFPMGDLHALSLCDRIIGPPSTFSQWASYSGNVPLCILESKAMEISPGAFRSHSGCAGLPRR
jgi:hypothetical protein